MGETEFVELDKLYQRFVVRDFVNDEYREQQMVKLLKQTFKTELLVRYVEKTLKAGIFDNTVPFVLKAEQGTRVIKPLAFDQKTPLKTAEHGEQWVSRIQKLTNNNVVMPDKVLFTVERPLPDKTDFVQVYDDIVGEIKNLGVSVEQFANMADILQFAKAGIENETNAAQHH
jgi:hypothetical protein